MTEKTTLLITYFTIAFIVIAIRSVLFAWIVMLALGALGYAVSYWASYVSVILLLVTAFLTPTLNTTYRTPTND